VRAGVVTGNAAVDMSADGEGMVIGDTPWLERARAVRAAAIV